ncbi:MAG: hypothetical protein QCI82_03535 [Candidatus Thermoplasmatota archaeon]|nr:hypothetical protein [Candidatus Thermoplasmatota archaeon]
MISLRFLRILSVFILSTVLFSGICSGSDFNEREPNDSFDRANRMIGNDYVRGYVNLGDVEDIDYFSYSIPANRKVNISIFQQSSGFIKFMVYDENRDPINGTFRQTIDKGEQLFVDVINEGSEDARIFILISGKGEYRLNVVVKVIRIDSETLFNARTIPFIIAGIAFAVIFVALVLSTKRLIEMSMKVKPRVHVIAEDAPEIFDYPKQ